MQPDDGSLRTDVPHSARVYDALLGGKDNFAVDRATAEKMTQILPGLRTTALANRQFMVRVARHLTVERGIRQFLDVGTGLPTSPNLHQVVQAVDPASRIVYVDNDPLVLVHARALLTSTPEGRTGYVDADLRDVEAIFRAPEFTLDTSEPIAVTLIAVLHFIEEDDLVQDILARLMKPLCSGSVLALSMTTTETDPDNAPAAFAEARKRGIPNVPRTKAVIERMFDGLDLLPPGVVPVHRWRPDDQSAGKVDDRNIHVYGGVAVKP